ncbi:hypothetical protein Jab_1c04180 [Janthinobacterium sp. HH01]|uniref:hypothetical protein n=1 Tax=Janthinobacterium sp. HH01 TaxID=1198452 RepID=UPI0002AE97C6|nr:hypothetical protein [Janthinobacterium sp. HH01]ELX11831.1 hypothetical protein Jab_1c04180 [Janthinobacterium sp. HH01]
MRLRYSALIVLPLLLAACGDSFKPVDVYMAKTPECSAWQEGSRYDLPRGISVSTTPPVTLPDGGAEFTFVYLVPRGERAMFLSREYHVTAPKGAVLAKAELVSFYQRATNSRPEIVDVIPKVPDMLVAGATSDDTIWRVRLRVKDKLPERFDVVPPAFEIALTKYPMRTFTYRYFADRKAFGLCS